MKKVIPAVFVAALALSVAACQDTVAPVPADDLVETPSASVTGNTTSLDRSVTFIYSTVTSDFNAVHGVHREQNGVVTTQAVLFISDPFCTDMVTIEKGDFSWSLESATLKASLTCGDVDLSWSRTGPIVRRHFESWASRLGLTGCAPPPGERILHRVFNGIAADASVSGTIDGTPPGVIQEASIELGTSTFTVCQ